MGGEEIRYNRYTLLIGKRNNYIVSWVLAVQPDENADAVIKRVNRAPSGSGEVVLAVPRGAVLFSSLDGLKRVKHAVEARGRHLRLRTKDAQGQALAHEAGIALYALSSQRPVVSDIAPPGTRPASAAQKKPERPAPEPKRPRQEMKQTDEAVEPEVKVKTEAETEDEGAADAAEAPKQQQQKEKAQEKKTKAETSAVSAQTLAADEGMRVMSTRASLRERLPGFLKPLMRLEVIIGILALAGGALAFTAIFPRVELQVRPHTEALAFTHPMRVAVGDTGETASVIQGQKISVEDQRTREVPASGKEEVSERARGQITIFNKHSSEPQTLVATTRFLSQDGKLFRLDETVIVPGAQIEDGEITPSSITATVTADEPGPEYNIGPSTFSIPGFSGTPKYQNFTARSQAPMSGGARGEVSVVQEEDVAKAKEGLAEELSETLSREFQDQIPKQFILLEQAQLETVIVETDVAADEVADKVTATAQGKISAIVFAKEDFDEEVREVLAERIPENTEVVPESITTEETVLERNLEQGILELEVAIETRVVWQVDPQAVSEAVAGLRDAEVRGWISRQPNIDSVRIRYRPGWVKKIPENPDRINVVFDLDGN